MSNEPSSKLEIYLNFPGHCEAAFKFYEAQLGGSIKMMMPQQKIPENFPKEWKKPILHAVMEIGGMTVRGADIPNAEPMRSAYLTLVLNTPEKAEEVYQILSEGGTVFMKMEKTFFANRFAQLRDKFGVSWMLLNEVA
ncbi:MAG: VOC family protein [Bacteroidetes bacterium]|nr:VOC family protein [Bacteroidota bacterium]